MTKLLTLLAFIIWMLFTVVLTLSIIGLLLLALEDSSRWFSLGEDLVSSLKS